MSETKDVAGELCDCGYCTYQRNNVPSTQEERDRWAVEEAAEAAERYALEV